MAYQSKYKGKEVEDILDNALLKKKQTFSDSEKKQVKENLGIKDPDLSDYATKKEVEDAISEIPTPDVGGQISAALVDYVKKVEGKGLSTHDFTNDLKAKLETIIPNDISELETEIGKLETALNTLVGGNASNAIESFNEIIAFLENVSDKDTLEGILAGVAASIPTKVSQLDNDKKFITTEEVDSKLEALTGNDLLAIEISEVGEVSVTYGEKSDFVGGQIRETGELVLEFNIE